jgi:pyruvate ferredoxin oxidoreductase beta subunit
MVERLKSFKDAPREDYLVSGHSACQGCGITIAARWITKGLGCDTIVVNATGCMEVVGTIYPNTSWKIPWLHVAFENTAAVASGVEAALKVLMRKGRIAQRRINVLALAGDGGTADIGLQALSGALERRHRLIYVCYDNEAYMNTGVQRSGSTPYGSSTTTTPPGVSSIGKALWKKEMPAIAAAHRIPYVATASTSYPLDLINKVKKAAEKDGPSYIHVLAPCPTGWGFEPSSTIEIGRLAVQTGIWPLYEIEEGQFKLTVNVPRRRPVTDYLKLQRRFKHLTEKEIEYIQQVVNQNAERTGLGPLAT